MGLYPSNCGSCGKGYMWHSSSMINLCGECYKKAGGGFHKVKVKSESGEPNIYYVAFSKANNLEEAKDFLIKENGIDKDKIID